MIMPAAYREWPTGAPSVSSGNVAVHSQTDAIRLSPLESVAFILANRAITPTHDTYT